MTRAILDEYYENRKESEDMLTPSEAEETTVNTPIEPTPKKTNSSHKTVTKRKGAQAECHS